MIIQLVCYAFLVIVFYLASETGLAVSHALKKFLKIIQVGGYYSLAKNHLNVLKL